MTLENPYERDGKWFFYDEMGCEYGPYKSQQKAARELKSYCRWLDKGPTRWQRFWWPIIYWRGRA